MALPPTLTRTYYRERTNPRMPIATRTGGYVGRCGKGSRWLRAAFDVMDVHKELRVVASTKDKVFAFYIDGEVRTVQDTWLNNVAPSRFFDSTYTICGAEERVGGRLTLGHGNTFVKCPTRYNAVTNEPGIIRVENPAVRLLNASDDRVVNSSAVVMSQLYTHNPDVFIMKRPPPGCRKSFSTVRHNTKSFLQVILFPNAKKKSL